MKNTILSARKVCKTFSQGGTKTQILKSVSADIYDGDFTVIMGASGAGKSTLLYSLSGMDGITDGEVLFDGKNISGLSEKKQARLRSESFGFVFQQTHLASDLTLFENVAVAGYVGKKAAVSSVREKALDLLRQMNVDNAKDRLPSQVSGGEAQRAAIARAMINSPKMIFADEPTGALDKSNSAEVMRLLTELNGNGQSILMVTHDIRAAIHGNRILYMEDGKILSELNLPPYSDGCEKPHERVIGEWLSALRW